MTTQDDMTHEARQVAQALNAHPDTYAFVTFKSNGLPILMVQRDPRVLRARADPRGEDRWRWWLDQPNDEDWRDACPPGELLEAIKAILEPKVEPVVEPNEAPQVVIGVDLGADDSYSEVQLWAHKESDGSMRLVDRQPIPADAPMIPWRGVRVMGDPLPGCNWKALANIPIAMPAPPTPIYRESKRRRRRNRHRTHKS